jgi:succinate-semialdehyde dehydrogenase/glutarate-semialdehyde dehydrogenase
MSVLDSKYWKNQCYVNGIWVTAQSGQVIKPKNPATGSILGEVPSLSCEEASSAIIAAETAWFKWRELTAVQRAEYIYKFSGLLLKDADIVAEIMTLESGKPLAESKGEFLVGVSYLNWFAEEGRRAYGEMIPSPWPGTKLMTILQPVGVVLAITPWNFPAAMILRKLAASLAAGCATVIRPASQTPFTALAIAAMAEEAGMPAGVINVITGSSSELGEFLAKHPLVRKISFTGSTQVGKRLMAWAAGTIKKITMELGGNAPFIVFEDASPEFAAQKGIAGKFRNAGQVCVAVNRFFVHESIYDVFTRSITEKTISLKVGNGLEQGVNVGPLININAVEHVESLIEDARKKGARIEVGGKPHNLGGNFFEPTVISGVTSDMRIFNEEIFGPVASIISFNEEEEVVNLANATPYGLASYVFTNDLGRAFRVSEALEYGMVGVNDVTLATSEAPFGGVKESGLGRESSLHGLRDYLDVKFILIGAGK